MFANKHAKILIALVCAVLGFMLATQFKTTERQKKLLIFSVPRICLTV